MLILVIVRDHSAYVLRPHTIPNSPVRGIHRCPTGKAKVIPGGTTTGNKGHTTQMNTMQIRFATTTKIINTTKISETM
jgi:hypothetical protein